MEKNRYCKGAISCQLQDAKSALHNRCRLSFTESVCDLHPLPIDKSGADLLFQVISLRYEQGSTLITSNRAFKDWPKIFNNDSTLTSAILDRLLHHAETVIIEGKSFRIKGKLEP